MLWVAVFAVLQVMGAGGIRTGETFRVVTPTFHDCNQAVAALDTQDLFGDGKVILLEHGCHEETE